MVEGAAGAAVAQNISRQGVITRRRQPTKGGWLKRQQEVVPKDRGWPGATGTVEGVRAAL